MIRFRSWTQFEELCFQNSIRFQMIIRHYDLPGPYSFKIKLSFCVRVSSRFRFHKWSHLPFFSRFFCFHHVKSLFLYERRLCLNFIKNHGNVHTQHKTRLFLVNFVLKNESKKWNNSKRKGIPTDSNRKNARVHNH